MKFGNLVEICFWPTLAVKGGGVRLEFLGGDVPVGP